MKTPNLTETTESKLPESGTRCTDVLSDTLQGYAGIHQAEFDLQNGHLNLSFDPNVLNNEYALSLVRKASRQARRTVWQNLAFSMAVIFVLVFTIFGANLPLPLGVVGHEGSTVLVVLNGLRLLAYHL